MFIKSASHIGFSECSDLESWLTELEPIEQGQSLIEPDYKVLLNSRLLRRMSPILKLGSYAALDTLTRVDAVPEAIIVGSGLGCSLDTLTFLNELNTNLDSALSPTAFIRSTHNTVAGQIALLLKNQGYNMTFTQGSLSFESALSDAQLAIKSGEINSALVGGIDELSEGLLELLIELAESNGLEAPVIGHGSNFFYLEKEGSEGDIEVVDVMSFHNGQNETNIDGFLQRSGIDLSEVDLLLDGSSVEFADVAYETPEIATINYKQFCGEFFSASAFGMIMGYSMIKTEANVGEDDTKPIKTILINTGFGKEQGLILLRKK